VRVAPPLAKDNPMDYLFPEHCTRSSWVSKRRLPDVAWLTLSERTIVPEIK